VVTGIVAFYFEKNRAFATGKRLHDALIKTNNQNHHWKR